MSEDRTVVGFASTREINTNEAFDGLRRQLYGIKAGYDRHQDDTRSPLVRSIETLEDRARQLETGWGEMLAMMQLERNREVIRKGDPEHIDELFRLVDKFKARFDAAKVCEKSRTETPE